MKFTDKKIQIINTLYHKNNRLDSFADTNTLLELCNQEQIPFIHFWTMADKTLILGINDRHVPNLKAGLKSVVGHGYDYFLRNSGGLGVISDLGVINISLFIPTKDTKYTIDQGYQVMADFIQDCFPNIQIKTGEVKNSYCPGKFDLQVGGQKIAGISQRRSHDALVIMLYLGVFGDQNQRSQVVLDFYQKSNAYSQTKFNFPRVDPQTMTTLEELGLNGLSLQKVNNKFIQSITKSQMIVDTINQDKLLNSQKYQTEKINQLHRIRLRNEQIPLV